jgi:hypothetical protein
MRTDALSVARQDGPRCGDGHPRRKSRTRAETPLLVAASLALVALSTLTGCATRIVQPPVSTAPARAFIVDHGRTSSLVIPASDGGLLRYAYGDWDYYALGKTDLPHGAAALLWPTRGALGRARLQAPTTPESVRLQVTPSHSIHVVHVEQSRVLAFERRMEALYDSRRATEVNNPANGMTFVHHPRRYTYFWNSNHAVATWLRELGCETRGLSFRASWRVE